MQEKPIVPMLYTNIPTELLERQVYLEELMKSEGLLRHHREVEQAKEKDLETTTAYGSKFIKTYIKPVSDAILAEQERVKAGDAGRYNAVLKEIVHMPSDVLAFLAIRGIIDSIHKSPNVISTAIKIGGAVEDELRYRVFAETNKKSFQYALKRALKNTTYERRAKALNAMMQHTADGKYNNEADKRLSWEPWSQDKLCKVGVKLIGTVLSTVPIAKITAVKTAKSEKTQNKILPTPEFRQWTHEITEQSALLAPITLPCVIPPKRYTTPTNGGYHTQAIQRHWLIKTTDTAYLEMLSTKTEQMQPIYDAVNTAQETPWRVNPKVYRTLKTLWDKGFTGAGIPSQEDKAPPRCPKCGRPVKDYTKKPHTCFSKDPEIFKKWKQAAANTHASNARAFSKRLMFHRILWTAELYLHDEKIYFPYQLDFRGRLYATPQFLNPQGHDAAKGLLEFSDGKPITDKQAADWLAIHVANTYGYDKASFRDRVEWVEEHESLIRSIAENPIENTEWADADSPFCFLASCFEWTAFKDQGYGFISRLPIAQDGTCSGLQHYSAILRDPVGGAATNLLPSEKPQDIYAVVAQRTLEALSQVPVYDEDYRLAQQWLCSGLITRKTTKRAVMTLPYGSTLYSAKKYIREWLDEIREKDPNNVPWTLEETGVACSYLGTVVWAAIRSTVVAAAAAMDWLKTVARVVTDAELPVAWTTPSGLPVIQTYAEARHRRIETYISGGAFYKTSDRKKIITAGTDETTVRIKMTLVEDTDRLDQNKHVTGLAPNFIHSMDAAAMVFAVLRAKQNGVSSFALIHDSFATHAADSQQLAEDLRTAFVEMYERHAVLEELAAGFERLLPPEYVAAIPPLPQKGSLNLRDIEQSLYFFA